MPAQKDFKRLIRRRMQKTGESYTAARARLLQTDAPKKKAPAPPPAARVDYAARAGMSDAAIKANTGCDWKRWVDALDDAGAHAWPHRKIAEYVREKFGVPDWWTQAVTVGYERIKGLREIGQRRGGGYEATKSKTFAVGVARVFDAFAKPRTRSRWLPGVKLTVRTATPHKSVRITWHDGSSVQVWLESKAAKKCSASVQHSKLPDRDAATKMKAFWGERLEALAGMLAD